MNGKPTHIELEQRLAELKRLHQELNRTEQALRESEEKYKQLTEDSLIGVFIWHEFRYVYVNQRFSEIDL